MTGYEPEGTPIDTGGGAAEPTVSVIVVTYNSEPTIARCLRSIPEGCEVVVVDQSSHDGSVREAVRVRPDARVIRAGANRGFGAGCNLGAANSHGEVLIFLNPDASFGAGATGILAGTVLRENALVGPRIVDASGAEQTRARRWSRVPSDLGEVFMPTVLSQRMLPRDIPPDVAVYRTGGPVPYVQGACMAIGAENFCRSGGFDERYFLYHEEEAIARKLARLGVGVVLEPRAVITHLGGASTAPVREFAAGQYFRSKALFYLEFYAAPVAFGAALALWGTLLAMAALTPLRRIIGLRAENGSSWYRAAAAGVVSGCCGRMVLPP
ncbi:glycosyltransferase family 2 protein [Rhodococcus sp. NPDC003322]